MFIFSQIASDSSANYTVYYEISGQGVTTDPVGLFTLNKNNGMLIVTRAVDREKYPQFNVSLNISGLIQKTVHELMVWNMIIASVQLTLSASLVSLLVVYRSCV